MLNRIGCRLGARMLAALGFAFLASSCPLWAAGQGTGSLDGCYAITGTADTHLTPTGMEGTLAIEGDLELEGTLVGTVVGQDPNTGATFLDHVLSFDNGEMFTYGDTAILAPTADACVFSVWEHMHTWSGNGDFDGLTSGNVIVEGTANVCTGENDLTFSGELCFIAPVPGDLDGDGDIDYDDYVVFRSSLGRCSGDPAYLPEADYDANGCVSYGDYRIWLGYYRNQ